MLKNIDPLLTPDLLKLLAEMGHEDVIVLVDANFTAMRYREKTTSKTVIRLSSVALPRAAQAILSVLPLGLPSEEPIAYMQVEHLPVGQVNAAQQAVLNLLQKDPATSALPVRSLARSDFYIAAQEAYAIVQTGEQQAYGNFLFKKGVLTNIPS